MTLLSPERSTDVRNSSQASSQIFGSLRHGRGVWLATLAWVVLFGTIGCKHSRTSLRPIYTYPPLVNAQPTGTFDSEVIPEYEEGYTYEVPSSPFDESSPPPPSAIDLGAGRSSSGRDDQQPRDPYLIDPRTGTDLKNEDPLDGNLRLELVPPGSTEPSSTSRRGSPQSDRRGYLRTTRHSGEGRSG